MDENYIQQFVEESSLYNQLLLPQQLCGWMPHVVQTWLRNTLFGMVLFLTTGFLHVNFWRRYMASPKGSVVSGKDLMAQLGVSFNLIPYGALSITLTEYLAEKGWSRCYSRISEVGVATYLYYVLCSLVMIEVLTYWIHRWMHETKFVYRYIHGRHHVYNKESVLSPFMGWALHPLDAILMQVPHVLTVLVVPTHFTTNLALHMVEAAWGVMVHSKSNGLPWPFMDASFHNIHHTAGNRNYGNFTVWMDQFYGTLRPPKGSSDEVKKQ